MGELGTHLHHLAPVVDLRAGAPAHEHAPPAPAARGHEPEVADAPHAGDRQPAEQLVQEDADKVQLADGQGQGVRRQPAIEVVVAQVEEAGHEAVGCEG